MNFTTRKNDVLIHLSIFDETISTPEKTQHD